MQPPEEASGVGTVPSSAAPLQGLFIRVLGPLEVLANGQPVVVDTRKALAILAVAAVEGRPMARDELAVMFWPEADDESARGALRRTLSTLRAALGDRWLRVDRTRVELFPEEVWLDVRIADEYAAVGTVEGLAAAAALHRGDFMAGFGLRDSPAFDDWLAIRSEERRRLLADLLDRLDRAREAAGNLSGARVAAARRLELDPLDEAGQRRMMELLALAGDRAGAIRQYRRCVAVLDRELGVGPLEQTTALYEAIREGRHAPVEVRAARATAREGSTSGPFADLPLVGREVLLERLVQAWRAATPDGQFAVLEGEAGIGKTRLADAFIGAAEAAGAAALSARSYPSESAIPFGPIGELLRAGLARPDAVERMARIPAEALRQAARLVPLIRDMVALPATEEPLAEPAARLRLMEGLAATIVGFVAGSKPGLIWLDDFAWADASTVEVVSYLVNRLDGRPLLILATWRREDITDQLVAVVRAADRKGRGSVELLDRLDREAVVALVRAAPDRHLDAEAVVAESEGLPLYVVELIASTDGPAGSIPHGVRNVLGGRLAGVGGIAAQVLAAAAVVGRSFDFDLVRQTSGRSADETVDGLEFLVGRGILRDLTSVGAATNGYDFAHGRLRDMSYEGISLARRRLLHARAADTLRSSHLPGVGAAARMALVGNHEREAGRFGPAAEAFALAGREAAAIHAPVEALAHFEAALALGNPDTPAIRAAIGDARIRLGDYAGAIEVLEAAAGDVTDPQDLASIEQRLGTVHARRGDLAAADSHLVASAELLVGDGEHLVRSRADSAIRASLLASVLADRALVAHRLGDEARAEELAADALATLGTPGDHADDDGGDDAVAVAERARPHQVLGLVALARGEFDKARTNLERALDEAGGLDLAVTVASRHALALVAARSGDLALATALAEDALIDGRRLGDRHVEAALENTLADLLHVAGRDDESMAHLKVAVALFAEVGGRPGDLEPEIWKLVEW